jgi:hypothetical protein
MALENTFNTIFYNNGNGCGILYYLETRSPRKKVVGLYFKERRLLCLY